MNTQEAKDIIFKVFRDVWNPLFPVVWDDKSGTPPNSDTNWARVFLRHSNGGQSSLAGEIGNRRFTDEGLVTIQIFSPINQGRQVGTALADVVKYAYEDARTPVWFRNARAMEGSSNGMFTLVNVYVDFNYDHVR